MAEMVVPLHIKAEMARKGIAPMQLQGYEDPERGWVDPMDDMDTKAAIRHLLSEIWKAPPYLPDRSFCVCGHSASKHNGPRYSTGLGTTAQGCDECRCSYLALMLSHDGSES